MSPDGSIAGWEDSRGDWHNTEAGDYLPSEAELAESDRVVIRAVDEDGEAHYFTTSDLTYDYGVDDFLADAEDRYGTSFV